MKRLFLTLFLGVIVFVGFANVKFNPVFLFSDTLMLEELKSEAFHHLTKSHNYDSAIVICNQGIDLSVKFGNSLYHGKLLSYKGLAFSKQEMYDSAALYLSEAIRVNEKSKHTRELSICYSNLGNVYFRQGLYDNALVNYKIASELSEECGRTKGVIVTLNNIGNIYKRRGNYPEAVNNYQAALQMAVDNEMEKSHAHALENLGNCYSESGNLDLALRYYKESLLIKERMEDNVGIVNSMINMGQCMSKYGEKEEALATYLDALDLAESSGTGYQVAVLNSNISAVYITLGQYHLSLHHSTKAYRIHQKSQCKTGLISSSQNMAEAFMKLKQYDNAIQLLDSALLIAEDPNLISTRKNLYETVSDLYSEIGNYKKALEYKNLSHETGDSIMNSEVASQLEELNIKYETAQKEKRIAVQELTIINQKEDIFHRKQITRMIVFILLALIGFSVGLTILYLQKRNALRVLVRQNKEIGEREKLEQNFSIPEVIPVEKSSNEVEKKYANSTLSDKEKRRILSGLNQLMNADNLYLNKQLCIEDVADALSTNRRYLSQLINENFSINFSNYINDFRVRKARQLLMNTEYDHLTIEAIGIESGFHSRVAFNNAFKKFTGVTPSFFKNNRNS